MSEGIRAKLIKDNIPLIGLNSWQVGGNADLFALPANIEELIQIQKYAKDQALPITVLGGGTNVLISDQGIAGLTISLKSLNKVSVAENNSRLEIIAEAGLAKSEMLKIFLKYKISPALFMAGLPGQVGGGIAINAGVSENFKPREFVEITDWIEVLKPDGKIIKYSKNDLKWSYRHCIGWQPGIIIKVGMSWKLEPEESILNQVKDANVVRLAKQPLYMPSCGSVFINPPADKAAKLIESCGLKGFQIGQAQVSLKHANFVVNLGKADAKSIWLVIQNVQKVVQEKTGVKIETEVVRIGRW
jgi:UDP-N-acetylmuramate dehydrogenase